MVFSSFVFVYLFLPLFLGAYFVTPRRGRNLTLALASYVFYGWWDWRFLGLIVLSSLVDHQVGLALGRTTDPRARRRWLGLSLAANLGMLGTFKYYDFFVTSLAGALAPMGIHLHPFTLDWVLPVGISFYTFQTLSYTIDVYRRDLEPTRDMLAFFAYVAFFPQLVAGPIERATNLLPQFLSPRRFDPARAVDGLRQMLWGLFKKVVIADNCARVVDDIFSRSDTLPGPVLVLGA
ncbi:MAG: MBOAT family protein, partial [Planctomycetes bacterium]|nr:MBOAT family protein [Planctomycetota bacterium]